MRKVNFVDLGCAGFQETWDLQMVRFDAMIASKIARRKEGLELTDPGMPDSYLYFVEHPHVLTLGKSGDPAHVVASPERLQELGVEYHAINRGGDITYHGPGQLVGYPILDLDQFFTDIGRYMRVLEEAIMLTCAEYGLETGRINGLTGVWVDPEAGMAARKIAALGVKCSRWVTMHGFAFNIDTDLYFFNLIVPCGIRGRGVTTLANELARINKPMPAFTEVKWKVRDHLVELFDMELYFEK